MNITARNLTIVLGGGGAEPPKDRPTVEERVLSVLEDFEKDSLKDWEAFAIVRGKEAALGRELDRQELEDFIHWAVHVRWLNDSLIQAAAGVGVLIVTDDEAAFMRPDETSFIEHSRAFYERSLLEKRSRTA